MDDLWVMRADYKNGGKSVIVADAERLVGVVKSLLNARNTTKIEIEPRDERVLHDGRVAEGSL